MLKALALIGLGARFSHSRQKSPSLKRAMARVRILIRIRASSVIGTGATRARIAHAKGRSGSVIIEGCKRRCRVPHHSELRWIHCGRGNSNGIVA